MYNVNSVQQQLEKGRGGAIIMILRKKIPRTFSGEIEAVFLKNVHNMNLPVSLVFQGRNQQQVTSS